MFEPIIIDELGLINGRDAIYLHHIEFESTHSVILKGEFNSRLCEKLKQQDRIFIPFSLSFSDILEFRLVELDFYSDANSKSNFEKLTHSERINFFSNHPNGFKVKDAHQHFLLHTYDDVIEVIAASFELKFIN